jgi:hypothetical protein
MDAATKTTVQKLPLLSVKAGPRDGDKWIERLKEELACLVKFVEINKSNDRCAAAATAAGRAGMYIEDRMPAHRAATFSRYRVMITARAGLGRLGSSTSCSSMNSTCSSRCERSGRTVDITAFSIT